MIALAIVAQRYFIFFPIKNNNMDALQAIQERRSVKSYDPQHVMPQADIDQLMDLLLLTPTSFNIQNWRFIIVQNPELRAKIKAASWGQAQVSEASMLLIICADLHAHARQPERYWANAPENVQNMLVPMIGKFYEGNEALQRDEAMRSTGLAGQTAMIAAKAMGYDSCPMVGFDPNKVAELIQLPEHHVIGMMLTIGKALKPAQPRGGQLPKSEVVFVDTFQKS
jgi:nitroreductase